jgi:hypothetical protein
MKNGPGPHLGIRVHGIAEVFSCFLLTDGIAKKANPAEAGLVCTDWRVVDDSLDVRGR